TVGGNISAKRRESAGPAKNDANTSAVHRSVASTNGASITTAVTTGGDFLCRGREDDEAGIPQPPCFWGLSWGGAVGRLSKKRKPGAPFKFAHSSVRATRKASRSFAPRGPSTLLSINSRGRPAPRRVA